MKLPDAITATITSRAVTHGDFVNTAHIAQGLKDFLKSEGPYQGMSSVQREALDMICTKLARIIAGDPNHREHWHDIAGYAQLAETSIPEVAIKAPPVMPRVGLPISVDP